MDTYKKIEQLTKQMDILRRRVDSTNKWLVEVALIVDGFQTRARAREMP